MKNDKELKAEITKRWNVMTDRQTSNPFNDAAKSRAFYQLEFLLVEQGLLAQRRDKLPIHKETLLPE
jgi:hypothetical protein